VDLSKAFDMVSWLYIRLLLIHLGFAHSFVTWILNCINYTSFTMLINGSTSPFFKAEHGIRQGYPLSPLLFLLVAESLNRMIHNVVSNAHIKGIHINANFSLSHSFLLMTY
jgi:hypothetical protein